VKIVEKLSQDRLAIFLFHGVVLKDDYRVRNYTRKHLPREVFFRHMKELKAHGTPMSMDQVVDHLRTRRPFGKGSFVVTFDDGFENNYSIARPILKELKIPAAVYVTTGFIEDNSMSWIDRLEYCFEVARISSVRLPWVQDAVSVATPAERRAALDSIRFHVKRDAAMDVDALVSDIFRQSRMDEVKESRDPLDLKMSWGQVAELGRDPDFIVGGHTHRHRIMSHLSAEELAGEVDTSLGLLQRKAGISSRHYSYPEGLRHCYGEEVIAFLKGRGIVCCPTAEDGDNGLEEDLFHLKRIFVTS